MDRELSVPAAVLAEYGLDEADVKILAGGRTNRTMRVRSRQAVTGPAGSDANGVGRDLVIQRLLGGGNRDLLAIMENLVRVTAHLDWQRSMHNRSDSWYPVLVPTNAKLPFILTDEGTVWRAFVYREGQILRGAQPAATLAGAAAIYGRFVAETAEFGGPTLVESFPQFHDLDVVFETLMQDLEHAEPGRAEAVVGDMQQLTLLKTQIDELCAADGLRRQPDRVVHNDTKLSNVLFDNDGVTASAVLDLDLVMMGPLWHDVGDLMRSACWHGPTASDEHGPDLSTDLLEVVIAAFVEAGGETVSNEEVATFAAAGPRLSFELALRYLNDHLRAEPHLAVAGENGHLRRGRANLNLAIEMLTAYDALRHIADSHIARRS